MNWLEALLYTTVMGSSLLGALLIVNGTGSKKK
jgi:hypothetical protein